MALSVSALPTIHGQFEYQARKTPNAIALVDTGCVKKSSSKPELRNFDEDKEAFVDEETKPSQLTYEDLDSRTNQLAHYLIKQGVKPGAAVGVYIEPSSAHVITVLAVLKAGGVCVLMDPEHHANEQLKDMMEKS